jgi:hypothetical protein
MKLLFPVIILGIAGTKSENGVGQLTPVAVARMYAHQNRAIASTLHIARIERCDTHEVQSLGGVLVGNSSIVQTIAIQF